MVKVKICGLTRDADIEAVNIIKPDYIGFVFARSRRRVAPDAAARLRDALHPDIIPVGVFVDEQINIIRGLTRSGIISMIQLHGSEDEAYIRELKSLTDVPVIRSAAVEEYGDAQKWDHTAADYLLLDNKGGGAGRRFDWGLIGSLCKPIFLAGGIDPQNVAEAIRRTSPFAIDVSSGVETDGMKDPAKISGLVRRVREEGISING